MNRKPSLERQQGTSSALEVDLLGRRLSNDFAITDVSFACRSGWLIGIIGPNGSGKTSLLDLICGRLRPDVGTILLHDRRLDRLSFDRAVREGVGRTFQTSSLPPELTVAQVLSLAEGTIGGSNWWPSLRGIGRAKQSLSSTSAALLATFDLSQHAEAPTGTLSYGQTRLVAIVACLIRRPLLALLDEPFAGLDRNHVEKLVQAIARWRVQTGATVLVVEHNVRALAEMSDRMLLMDHGRLVAFDEPSHVLTEAHAREVFFA
jgi:ABC-type branched-subunit amino acid transport system ATPase component